MAIVVKLDDLLHDRRMTLTDLAGRIEMTLANLSILKTGKARASRRLMRSARRSRASPATFSGLSRSPQRRKSPNDEPGGFKSISGGMLLWGWSILHGAC
jgi:hypothetical protein